MATHQKKHIKNIHTNRELIISSKTDLETYGQVLSAKGDARFEVKLIHNNLLIIAKTRGSLIKGPQKKRIDKDDYVLIQQDSLATDGKYYIIHKYSKEDIKKLKRLGELNTINDISDSDDENKTKILIEDDIIENKSTIEINDDFIANI
jgi:translation initiation factor IF-1